MSAGFVERLVWMKGNVSPVFAMFGRKTGLSVCTSLLVRRTKLCTRVGTLWSHITAPRTSCELAKSNVSMQRSETHGPKTSPGHSLRSTFGVSSRSQREGVFCQVSTDHLSSKRQGEKPMAFGIRARILYTQHYLALRPPICSFIDSKPITLSYHVVRLYLSVFLPSDCVGCWRLSKMSW